jgi:hypothetical protein
LRILDGLGFGSAGLSLLFEQEKKVRSVSIKKNWMLDFIVKKLVGF